jgi:alpha-L-fucosidase
MKKTVIVSAIVCMAFTGGFAQEGGKTLHELQQAFVNLRFGMFIHYNIPTYMDDDWADPDASPSIFNPGKLDCRQWAKAAKDAGMSYGCLTTKHHSGFCIWNTRTTDYCVMNSPFGRDVVKEFVEAFSEQGLKVMLYFSILDTHHKLRPHQITPQHISTVKEQLTELLTGYGEITALIIDGWDAPWSRISYDDIPFEDIYYLVKSLQPNCLLMDLNAAKYPAEALFYTDIKSYEQGAGQHISKEGNRLPALSCLPINENWFWKKHFPTAPVKSPADMVNNNIIPFNRVHCNFILNVAPNRDGLIDGNAVTALKEIGKLWKNDGACPELPETEAPIISSNIAKFKPCNSSWGYDMNIMDFANDDRFGTSWQSNPAVKTPWYEVELGREMPFNTVVITEGGEERSIRKYHIEYLENNVWKTFARGAADGRVKIHRSERVWGNKVRITVEASRGAPAIAEFGVYDERRY